MRPFVYYVIYISCYIYINPVGSVYPTWFTVYKRTHRKNYTPQEELAAFRILKNKYRAIQSTHFDGVELRLHADSDRNLTYVNYHVQPGRRGTRRLTQQYQLKASDRRVPTSWDWRDHGAVTRPLRQGVCGGCYAFSAVGHLEYWFKKKTGHLRQLSVQQALDCSSPESGGCDGGGLMEDVFKHSYGNPIGPRSFDPWKGGDSVCKRRLSHPYARVMHYVSMSDEFHDPIEDHLSYNVYRYGPIPVAIDATSTAFEHYGGGILQKHQCGSAVDHAALVVGYTPTYWILKNSWGTSWGEHGYIRIARGHNVCGINSYASFATDVQV